MSKKRKRVTIKLPAGRDSWRDNDNPLSARAESAELLYNTLKKVAPKDIDGVQRAYVTSDDDGFNIDTSTQDEDSIGALYGMESISVAVMGDPFPLIPMLEGPPQFDARKQFHRGMLRQALRKIVDEA